MEIVYSQSYMTSTFDEFIEFAGLPEVLQALAGACSVRAVRMKEQGDEPAAQRWRELRGKFFNLAGEEAVVHQRKESEPAADQQECARDDVSV